eukprot:1155653-Rhodomonas_salina.3
MVGGVGAGFQQGLQRSFKGKGARGNNDEMEMTSLARPEVRCCERSLGWRWCGVVLDGVMSRAGVGRREMP